MADESIILCLYDNVEIEKQQLCMLLAWEREALDPREAPVSMLHVTYQRSTCKLGLWCEGPQVTNRVTWAWTLSYCQSKLNTNFTQSNLSCKIKL